MEGYIYLSIAALLPAILSIVLKFVFKEKKLKSLSYMSRQVIYGVLFGALAIVGTEWGIKINGAIVNARDAAVICAGLLFGGPAGIIAGVIGGVERWFAVYWGAGTFTQLACSISTCLCGVFTAFARKFMFDNKRPGWLMGFAVAISCETFHLSMVFFTNLATPVKALEVVKACTIPMIIANSVPLLISGLVLDYFKRNDKKARIKSSKISSTLQKRLLGTIVLALTFTYSFTFILENNLAMNQRDQLLNLAIKETKDDVTDASNYNMLEIARSMKKEIGLKSLMQLKEEYKVHEINLSDANGIVIDSTESNNIGFVFSSTEQSSAFLCLLEENGPEEYVQEYMPTGNDENIWRKYAGVRDQDGFIQIGYDYDEFVGSVSAELADVTKNRHVGEKGPVIVVDKGGKIVSFSLGFNMMSLTSALRSLEDPGSDKIFQISIEGTKYYGMYSNAEGYAVYSMIPVAEITQTRDMVLYAGIFNEILVFSIVYVVIYFLLQNRVVSKIEKVGEALQQISDGELNHKVKVTGNYEFDNLSNHINKTVKTLKGYIAEASKRIDDELQLAKNIQFSALPQPYPMFEKYKAFNIAASMFTAKEVGGDFYDFYVVDNKVNFLIADVSGKGIPAAMFMMRAKTELKTLSESGVSLDMAFRIANNELCEGNEAGMFVTAWQGQFDYETGVLKFSNAGHNAPLVKRNGKFEYLKSRPNLVLGGMEGIPYRADEITLEPGDIVYLYTDGVTEATNANNELYGEQRLLDRLNSKEFLNVEEVCSYIKEDIDDFVGKAPQFDDITMVCFKYNGKLESNKLEFNPSKLEDIPAITDFIESELSKYDCPFNVIMKINIAIDEIYSNIVRYAYGDSEGPAEISVDVNTVEKIIKIKLVDSGMPYNPLEKDDPDVTLSAEDRKIGGLGIYMVKQSMDEVKYNHMHGKNNLTLIKKY